MLKALPRPVALAGAKGDPLAPVDNTNRFKGSLPRYEPVLKGSLTPGRKKAEVFGHFGHRPMPHSVVVRFLSRHASHII